MIHYYILMNTYCAAKYLLSFPLPLASVGLGSLSDSEVHLP